MVIGVLIGSDAVRRASGAVLLRAFGAVLAAQSLLSEELDPARRGAALPGCARCCPSVRGVRWLVLRASLAHES